MMNATYLKPCKKKYRVGWNPPPHWDRVNIYIHTVTLRQTVLIYNIMDHKHNYQLIQYIKLEIHEYDYKLWVKIEWKEKPGDLQLISYKRFMECTLI